jgi:hypothetical protein
MPADFSIIAVDRISRAWREEGEEVVTRHHLKYLIAFEPL